MSMLSETRRRSKWAFNPRGLKNGGEHEKKGKNLLEKMGWSEGQGLGKSNQGIVDPITLKVKNDAKGVGFTGRAEAVLAHQDDFQSLLEDLAKSHENSAANSVSNSTNASGDEENNSSDNSKESNELGGDNSKSQKRDRKRYHKSRGAKDATKYSHKDLEGIVGSSAKKAKISDAKIDSPLQDVEINSNDAEELDELSARPSFALQSPANKETAESATKENELDDKRFSNGGDLNAYFARKMKEKALMGNGLNPHSTENNDMQEVKRKKSKKKKQDAKTIAEEKSAPSSEQNEKLTLETQDKKQEEKFTHGGDLNAYFARKMEEKKLKQTKQAKESPIQDESKEKKEPKKSKKSKKLKKDSEDRKEYINDDKANREQPSFNGSNEELSLDRKLKQKSEKEPEVNGNQQIDTKPKKHKKSKKHSKDAENIVNLPAAENNAEQCKHTGKDQGDTVKLNDAQVSTKSEKKSSKKSSSENSTEHHQPKKSKKAKKSSKLQEEQEDLEIKAEIDKAANNELKCDNHKKKKSKKDKENKNGTNESANMKKKEKTQLTENCDEIIGFKGTNILSIKGYGVK